MRSRIPRVGRLALAACGLLFALTSELAEARIGNAHRCYPTQRLTVKRQSVGWHLFDVTVLEPIEQSFHLIRLGRRLIGLPIRAENLHDGHLVESIFLVDRDPAALSPEEVRWGPTSPGQLPQPPF